VNVCVGCGHGIFSGSVGRDASIMPANLLE